MAGQAPRIDTIETKQEYKWQRKDLSSAEYGVGVYISDLTFNNLTSGTTYRYFGSLEIDANPEFDGTTTQKVWKGEIQHNSLTIGHITFLAGNEDDNHATLYFSVIFEAEASDVKIYVSSRNAEGVGVKSYAILEELPAHVETTNWT